MDVVISNKIMYIECYYVSNEKLDINQKYYYFFATHQIDDPKYDN